MTSNGHNPVGVVLGCECPPKVDAGAPTLGFGTERRWRSHAARHRVASRSEAMMVVVDFSPSDQLMLDPAKFPTKEVRQPHRMSKLQRAGAIAPVGRPPRFVVNASANSHWRFRRGGYIHPVHRSNL